MTNKYKNSKGVYIESHTDKGGKDHISFYDKNPSNPKHQSIHVNYNAKTGKGNIVESNGSGGKTTTGIGCYLTTACIRHFKDNFDDNCFELTILRWFRDNFVSQDDVRHYYKIAPIIVEGIEATSNIDIIYDYIYENVVDACVTAILEGDYEFAYNRYKSSILSFEESFAKPLLQKKMVKVLNKSITK
ncbi:MAG: hypothetical protein IJ501_02455 [Bacilli bacterium]|nr:hypothetical protein [Bacilli bacterium]